MPEQTAACFTDNWAYLRTELAWLDRLLMVAVSRYRKDLRSLDRMAQTTADRVSHHWWRGVITLDGKAAYDEVRPPGGKPSAPAAQRKPYQQQVEERVRASMARGIGLALPMMSDRLQLSVFEKQLVLLALAPEVNRRYGSIYRFLQGQSESATSDLPTLDLGLRLFCRNDQEWRRARQHLATHPPLLRHNVVQFHPSTTGTRLGQTLQILPDWVDFLLAETPTTEQLDVRLQPLSDGAEGAVSWTQTVAHATWEAVVLPDALTERLRGWSQGVRHLGGMVIFAGPLGTGKTLVAEAIAHDLDASLTLLDLSTQDPTQVLANWGQDGSPEPKVLLVRGADRWLRRRAEIPAEWVEQWLDRRQGQVTVLSVEHVESVAVRWQRRLPNPFRFPLPGMGDRQTLWQRFIPATTPGAEAMDWQQVARSRKLSGGQIRAIAHTALQLWQASGDPTLTWHHLTQAFGHHGHTLTPVPAPSKKTAAKPKSARKPSSPQKRASAAPSKPKQAKPKQAKPKQSKPNAKASQPSAAQKTGRSQRKVSSKASDKASDKPSDSASLPE